MGPLLLLLLLLAAPLGRSADPFAMFDYEEELPRGRATDCDAATAICRRQLESFVNLRARWVRRLAACRQRCAANTAGRKRSAAPSVMEKRQAESTFMRRHVRRTLNLLRLNSDDEVVPAEQETLLLRASVSELQVLQLRQFLAGDEEATSLAEADAILESVLSAAEIDLHLVDGPPRWLRRLRAHLTAEVCLLILAGLPAVWLVYALVTGRSWWHILSRLSVVAVFWHWQQLYKRELAKRHLAAIGEVPEHCRPSDQSWMAGLGYYLASFVSWSVPVRADCQRHQEAMVVNPFWEVTPVMAFSDAITTLLVHPAEGVGRGFGKFYRALAAEVPSLWLFPLILVSLATLLLVLLIVLRYWSSADQPAPVSSPPLHVCVKPGGEDVHLLVSSDGGLHVRPLGDAAMERTIVRGEESARQSGWLGWTLDWVVSGVAGVVDVGGRAVTLALSAGRAGDVVAVRDERNPAVVTGDNRLPTGGAGGNHPVSDSQQMASGDAVIAGPPEQSSLRHRAGATVRRPEETTTPPAPVRPRAVRSLFTAPSVSAQTDASGGQAAAGGGDCHLPGNIVTASVENSVEAAQRRPTVLTGENPGMRPAGGEVAGDITSDIAHDGSEGSSRREMAGGEGSSCLSGASSPRSTLPDKPAGSEGLVDPSVAPPSPFLERIKEVMNRSPE